MNCYLKLLRMLILCNLITTSILSNLLSWHFLLLSLFSINWHLFFLLDFLNNKNYNFVIFFDLFLSSLGVFCCFKVILHTKNLFHFKVPLIIQLFLPLFLKRIIFSLPWQKQPVPWYSYHLYTYIYQVAENPQIYLFSNTFHSSFFFSFWSFTTSCFFFLTVCFFIRFTLLILITPRTIFPVCFWCQCYVCFPYLVGTFLKRCLQQCNLYDS